jgi:hypothetical protein
VRTAALALVLVALAACDDSSPPVIADPAEFLAELAVAECEHLTRCGLYADTAQCTDRLAFPGLPYDTWLRPAIDPAWVDHVAGGTMSYSAARAGACVEGLRRASCNRGEGEPSCRSVFRGIAPAGTVTTSSDQCAHGGWSTIECDAACCTGACAEPGEPTGVLIHVVGEGESCGESAEGIFACEVRLTCVEGVCVRLAAGDTCYAGSSCPADMTCDGVCRPRDEVGEPCKRAGGWDTCNHLGVYCGLDERCHAFAVEDEACNDADQLCRPGLRCDPDSQRCAAVYAAGEACGDLRLPCERGTFCGTTDDGPRCIAALADGAACFESFMCTSGYCDGSTGQCATVSCP